MTDRRYRALEIMGGIYFFLGILAIIGGVIWLITGEFYLGFLSCVISLPLLAFNNFVELLINLEENTNNTAKYLKELVYGKEKKPKQTTPTRDKYVCTKCGTEVGDGDIRCRKCNMLLAKEGMVEKLK